MVASTSHGSRFATLGRYLVHGRRARRELDEDTRALRADRRVAWVAVRHLPTRDPEVAAKYMQAAAAVNVRVQKPVYHVALAFAPGDAVTREVMRGVAERLLRDLGLDEHQAVMVAHRDRAHPHLHLMINRVHPRTGRAWDDAWDYRRIETSLRVQERALGLRVVEGRHAPTPESALREADSQRRGFALAGAPFTDDVPPGRTGPRRRRDIPSPSRAEAEPMVTAESTRMLAYAERVLSDRDRVNPELARPLAELPARARFVARRLEQYEQVLQAGIDATVAREAFARARDAVADGVTAGRTAAGAESQFREALGRLYRDPASAGRAFEQSAARDGLTKAVSSLRDAPEAYGRLQGERAVGGWASAVGGRPDDRPARAAAKLAADLATRANAARAGVPMATTVGEQVTAMQRAEAQAVRAEAVLAGLPRGDALARSVARGTARLDDRAFAELRAALPTARAELAETFRDTTVQLLARESAGRVARLGERLADRTGVDVPQLRTPTAEQRKRVAALHGEAAKALIDGQELARALGGVGAARSGASERTVAAAALGTALAVDGRGPARSVASESGQGRRDGVQIGASPRARTIAASQAGRLVHQAVQALAPEELQALTTMVRVGAGLGLKAVAGLANTAVRNVATVQQAVRAGVGVALAGREVER